MSTLANKQLKAKINKIILDRKLIGATDLLLAQDEIGEIHLFKGKELKIIDTFGYGEYIGVMGIRNSQFTEHIAFIGNWVEKGKKIKNIENTLAIIGIDSFYLNQAGRLVVFEPVKKKDKLSTSHKLTYIVKSLINSSRYNALNWLVQDESGDIYILYGDAKLDRSKNTDCLYQWIPFNNSPYMRFICNPIKGKTIKTFRQAKAQLTINHWWIDSRGRLIVQDRNVPDSLKAQA